jgi:hypothetical protein
VPSVFARISILAITDRQVQDRAQQQAMIEAPGNALDFESLLKQHPSGSGAPILDLQTGLPKTGLSRDATVKTVIDNNQVGKQFRESNVDRKANLRTDLHQQMDERQRAMQDPGYIPINPTKVERFVNGLPVPSTSLLRTKVSEIPPNVGAHERVNRTAEQNATNPHVFYNEIFEHTRERAEMNPGKHSRMIPADVYNAKVEQQQVISRDLDALRREKESIQSKNVAQEKALEDLHVRENPYAKPVERKAPVRTVSCAFALRMHSSLADRWVRQLEIVR